MNVTPDRLMEFIGNHWIMTSGLFICTILLIQDILDSVLKKYKTVSPMEAVVIMNDENTVVVDVREPHEFSQGHIEGARHIPLGRISERAAELDANKAKPIVVTCQSGTRSPAACKKLSGLGFTQVFELKGGMVAWEEDKLPVTKKRK